ncbi:methylenetetrahydrofolate reductase [NAD(P)H] [Rubinisphaera italica]|uniref:Methylenetetrahydrofolate reductase n=1 Tax=Rubinisphaera italica TaxID=2527969 RepID=A0A5C5XAE0_9PLAN|nr:methylenetetrahydrofolate reductase [NAD(P)H] [Rubinisphaera italica]TWT59986.1 5,10-methylenetetrahydrofolate reductase [Rubinisphaera italica]
MNRLPDLLKSDSPLISIEIFPPKTEKGDELLYETLDTLSKFEPKFISCTYGAGGTTQTRTLELCQHIQKTYEIPATAHFTCVGSSRDELIAWLDKAAAAGIQNIMALRGDAPKGETSFKAVEGGLSYANELVSLIRERHPNMGIGVAAYPEKHAECLDADLDLANLKRKIDAGADAAFTQLFFDNDLFFAFRDRYEKAGCAIPLIPGIMPITEFSRIKRITEMCGTAFPAELSARLENVQDDSEAQLEIGIEFAIAQCQELLENNVPGVHFYALNKSQACQRILEALKTA